MTPSSNTAPPAKKSSGSANDAKEAKSRQGRKSRTSEKETRRSQHQGSREEAKKTIKAAEPEDDIPLEEDEDSSILDAEIVQDVAAAEDGGSPVLDVDVLPPEEEAPEEDSSMAVVDLEPEDDGTGIHYLTGRQSDGSDLPVLADNRLPTVKDNLQVYVQQVSRYPLLKPEEEHELAVRFRDYGDTAAGEKIVQAHLRLVVKIAMEFQRRWMQNVLDLVQEGNVGLIHALHKFDPDKGIKFSYYSSFWIKAYILKFIMDNFRMVKIGTTQVQRKLFFNLNRERQKLIAQGYSPDADMLSDRLGVSKNDVLDMEQRLSNSDVSLNVPVSDDQDSATRMDFLPALGAGVEESIASEEVSSIVRDKLQSLLPSLNEKELYILEHRLFTDSPMTLREIGERYHITRERIRQLEIRLLEKIKKHISGDVQDFSETWINS